MDDSTLDVVVPAPRPKKRRRGHNEGSIHQRTSDRLWVAEVSLGYGVDGKRIRRRLCGKTRAEANRKLQRALTDHQQGLSVQTRDQTIEQFLTHWLEAAVKPNLRAATYTSYEQACRVHLIPGLGRHRLSKLTAQHISSYMRDKQVAGTSASGVNYHRSILRTALNQAMRWDLVNRNVVLLTTPRPSTAFEAAPLSAAEADAFLRATQGERLEALYTVSLMLGLRRGEALGLCWQDIDLDAGTLTVRNQLQMVDKELALVPPKTRRSARVLPLPEPVDRALRDHRRRQAEERLRMGPRWRAKWDLVFPSTVGTPSDSGNVIRDYKRILAKAGLKDRRYHDLRHSCASFLAARGVSPRVVMEILGHSQLSTTTNIYTHVDTEQMREATGRLIDLFPAAGEQSR